MRKREVTIRHDSGVSTNLTPYKPTNKSWILLHSGARIVTLYLGYDKRGANALWIQLEKKCEKEKS